MSKGPEAIIQAAIVRFLRARQWHVMETHGNMYQCGFPDLYCTHHVHRQRWIEVKNPESYCFTPAQLLHFPQMSAASISIHILTAATQVEYSKLWQPPNWWQFLPEAKR